MVGVVFLLAGATVGIGMLLVQRLLNLRTPDLLRPKNEGRVLKLLISAPDMAAICHPSPNDASSTADEPPRVSVRRRIIRASRPSRRRTTTGRTSLPTVRYSRGLQRPDGNAVCLARMFRRTNLGGAAWQVPRPWKGWSSQSSHHAPASGWTRRGSPPPRISNGFAAFSPSVRRWRSSRHLPARGADFADVRVSKTVRLDQRISIRSTRFRGCWRRIRVTATMCVRRLRTSVILRHHSC